jgi:hypothetical protein
VIALLGQIGTLVVVGEGQKTPTPSVPDDVDGTYSTLHAVELVVELVLGLLQGSR